MKGNLILDSPFLHSVFAFAKCNHTSSTDTVTAMTVYSAADMVQVLFILLHYFVVEGLVVSGYTVDDIAGLADGFEVAGAHSSLQSSAPRSCERCHSLPLVSATK